MNVGEERKINTSLQRGRKEGERGRVRERERKGERERVRERDRKGEREGEKG